VVEGKANAGGERRTRRILLSFFLRKETERQERWAVVGEAKV